MTTPLAELIARPLAEWHEDIGPVLWWRFPVDEPPYVGTPLDCARSTYVAAPTDDQPRRLVWGKIGGWPGYHTHFTMIPIPKEPK